jgi:ankyrin repeat protein
MDGFDWICPTHEDKAAVIFSELMKTKVGRVWVTSRPVQKERLEGELSVSSFGMKRLSRESQKEMLRNLWKNIADVKEYELDNFLGSVNRSVHDEYFTGCPLYIMMIATVYEKELETNLKLENWQWTTIDVVNMYEVFVDRKLHIFLTEKQNADITNSSVLDILEDLKETLLNKFEKCALVAILPPSMLQSLNDKKIEEEIQPFLTKVQAGKDKTGIVMNVVDGKPQFVHRTFAEFFTARWFRRNFEFNRIVLKEIFFDRTYWFMTDVFDKMLARGCQLHCAVIDTDLKRFKSLLKERGDFNAQDRGGRTFTHLIAKHKWISSNIIRNDLEYEISFDITDSVLQWTPLQYAIKSKNWLAVELLLKSNVNRSGLDMIRQRAQDTDYIHPIIIHAVWYSYWLLLEYLSSIGVNIHQASDSNFPSPLHVGIRWRQTPVIRWLIQHGADCDTRYNDGQTPLFYAVKIGSLDVVRTLVEEGRASVDIRDVHGNTAIDWAKGYTSVPMYQHTFLWKYRVEGFKEIVKYLEERIKVTSSVCHNTNS